MSHDQPLPGPWYTDLEHEHTMVFAANKIAVADCAPYYASPYEAVCQANARLIAAAPDLLAAAKELAEWCYLRSDKHPYDAFKMLEAAIAKAEGSA